MFVNLSKEDSYENAFEAKLDEFEALAICLGIAHTRTEDALCVLLGFAEDDEENLKDVCESFDDFGVYLRTRMDDRKLCAWVPDLD